MFNVVDDELVAGRESSGGSEWFAAYETTLRREAIHTAAKERLGRAPVLSSRRAGLLAADGGADDGP